MKSLPTPFPAASFIVKTSTRVSLSKMRREGIRRPLLAAEMSDGTLRFFVPRRRAAQSAPAGVSWRSMNRRTACIATCCPRWPG